MIRQELIESLDEPALSQAKLGLAWIAQAGLVDAEIGMRVATLSQGFAEEPVGALTEKILDFRKACANLESLKELCEFYLTEVDL